MADRHDGRTALVTGAGSGIGRGIARRLADDGANVACVDIRADLAAETAELISAAGARASAFTADVRDRPAVTAAIAGTVAAFGGLDYVVNNAGLVTMSSFEELTDDEWDHVLDVNLKGVYVVTQLALPHLKQAPPGAAVVNLSTVESEVVVSSQGFCQVHYNASKGGVKMLTKALAVELSRYGIRVNAVAPGPIATGFVPGVDPTDPAVLDSLRSRLLVPRLGQPEDIAAAASFLLSSDASFITGAHLPVDGGWLTR